MGGNSITCLSAADRVVFVATVIVAAYCPAVIYAQAKSADSTSNASAVGGRETAASAKHRKSLEQYVLTHAGNTQRGRELFLDKKLNCATCHIVNGQGGNVGPDLSHVGGKFDRPHLLESLLEPSREIVEGYRTSVVITNDGAVRSGIVQSRTESMLTLVDNQGRTEAIPLEEIDAIDVSDVSTMPDGFVDTLSNDQLADLVSYLESLRLGGKATPGSDVVAPLTLPEGFVVEVVAKNLNACTALEIAADGRIFLCEQTGALRLIEDGELASDPLITLPVASDWERGLIGVAVDPDFPQSPYVYLCYIADDPFPHHRVSRFTFGHGRLLAESEKILLVGDDQRTLGGTVPAGHQGGALHFGPDGRLYIGIGDQTESSAAQSLQTLQGKLLRINRDGSIPSDNPLLKNTVGKYQAIWAYGLRNPYTFAFDPLTGKMLINDVGGKFEEVNRGIAGGNYGWPVAEHGSAHASQFVSPYFCYPEASICGGDFVPGNGTWPPEYHGSYLFADFVHGAIYSLTPTNPTSSKTFVTGLRRPVDLRIAADGNLYALLRNAWVIDDKFQASTGSLLRIVPPRPHRAKARREQSENRHGFADSIEIDSHCSEPSRW